MAGDHNASGDFKAHERTYAGFLSVLTKGTIACAVIAAFVIFLISR